MGLRSSMILCAGGVLSNLVLVPMIWFVGSHLDISVYPAIHPHLQNDGRRHLSQLRALHRSRSHCNSGHRRHHQVPQSCRRIIRHRSENLSSRRGVRAGSNGPRCADDCNPLRHRHRRSRRRRFPRATPGLLDGGRSRPLDDSSLLVLLYFCRGKRHRNHRAQSRVGHDHADHHHLLRRPASIRRFRARRECSL